MKKTFLKALSGKIITRARSSIKRPSNRGAYQPDARNLKKMNVSTEKAGEQKLMKGILSVCLTAGCFLQSSAMVHAETEMLRGSYVSGSIVANDGDTYVYTVSIGGSTANGVRTTVSCEGKIKRRHNAVYAQFIQNGVIVSSTTSAVTYSLMKGPSYSPYSRPGSLTGITSILSGNGSVVLQSLISESVSF